MILHFCLLDLLKGAEWKPFRDIMDILYREYFEPAGTELLLDESTVRNKLKEYVGLGLLEQKKDGRSCLYRCSPVACDGGSWKDAVSFFSEVNPLGVVGSFLLDKKEWKPEEDFFRYKHHYILHALDSQVLYELLEAMGKHCSVEIRTRPRKQQQEWAYWLLPLRIYISTQTGREYLLGYEYRVKKMSFFRLDNISGVKLKGYDAFWQAHEQSYGKLKGRLWGVSLGQERQIDHVELTVHAGRGEQFIVARLEREKRNGQVIKLDDTTYRYITDTHGALELLPWARTFIGRIESFHCSNQEVEKLFWDDLDSLNRMYLEDGDIGIQ